MAAGRTEMVGSPAGPNLKPATYRCPFCDQYLRR